MTDETTTPIALQGEPFSVARVFSLSLAVLSRNAGRFVAASTLISIPYIVLQTLADIAASRNPEEHPFGGYSSGLSMVQMVTFAVMQAVLTYGTLQDLRGRPAGIGECIRRGLSASSRLTIAALLYSLGLLLGVIALILPALVLYLMWWVTIPAITVEGLGVFAAFGRSRQLTAGRRWQILGLLAVVFVVYFVVLFAVAFAVPGIAADIAITLLVVLFSVFSSVLAAVGYYLLRVDKEGIAVEDIAKVFD